MNPFKEPRRRGSQEFRKSTKFHSTPTILTVVADPDRDCCIVPFSEATGRIDVTSFGWESNILQQQLEATSSKLPHLLPIRSTTTSRGPGSLASSFLSSIF